MANGRGTRWGEHLGLPKHLIEFDGETLLRRLVRQLREQDPGSDIVISSAKPTYETEGARRHVPRANELELDRFVPELISDRVCFLYGDTLYGDAAISSIVHTPIEELDFFGDEDGIVAVRSAAPDVLLTHLAKVRELFLAGEIAACVGWQVYQSYAGLPFDEKRTGVHFHRTSGQAAGFNSPADLEAFEEWFAATPGAAAHAGFRSEQRRHAH